MAEEDLQRRNAIYELRAWIQAHEKAQHREDVRSFRERHFPDGLLPRSARALEEWAKSFPPFDQTARPPDTGRSRWTSDSNLRLKIDTPLPGGGTEPRFFSVPYQSEGRELQDLAEALSATFGWHRPSAAAWLIMEGMEPRPFGIGVWFNQTADNLLSRLEPHELEALPDGQTEHLRLIVAAPADVPSHLVLYEIQRAQDQIRSKYAYPVPSKSRPYLDSTLEAVRFALKRNDGRSWLEVIREWNETHPESEFEASVEDAAAFGAIVRRCYSQVTGTKLRWKRPPGKPRKTK